MKTSSMRALLTLAGLGLLSALASGCYPGYDILRPAPLGIRGRAVVVLEPAFASPLARSKVAEALSRTRRDGSEAGVDAWLANPLHQMVQGCSAALTRSGFQVHIGPQAPPDPATYVRVRLELTDVYFGSTAGRVLGAIFGGRRRQAYPWIRANIHLVDPAQPAVEGLAHLHYEYRSNFANFHRITGPAGQRCALFVRDSLVIR
jgi:hypothetical protein